MTNRPFLFILLFLMPFSFVGGYAALLICGAMPIQSFSIEAAGQFGDAFGVISCLFSGIAFAGVFITIALQREEMKRSELAHEQNIKISALASLLSVYHQLAEQKQAELDGMLSLGNGAVGEALRSELDKILKIRNTIYRDLENAAGLDVYMK